MIKKLYIAIFIIIFGFCQTLASDSEPDTVEYRNIKSDFDSLFEVVEKMVITRLESLWYFRNEDIENFSTFYRKSCNRDCMKRRKNNQTNKIEVLIDSNTISQLPFNLQSIFRKRTTWLQQGGFKRVDPRITWKYSLC